MSGIFFSKPTDQEANFDGFFDGQNKIVDEGTELELTVYDGFIGQREGKAIQECFVNLSVSDASSEFFGQKYRFNAKIFDNDAGKRDHGKKNLALIDYQAGSPLTNAQAELTADSMQQWVGAVVRAKFGLIIDDEEIDANGEPKRINFIRGFAYCRDKVLTAGQQAAQVVEEEDEPIDF